MNRLIPLLLTAFACAAQAQQDYYGGQSQGYEQPLAAPSTIPGQRSSGVRVPQVQPAPNTPLPRQGQTQQGGIQWGSSTSVYGSSSDGYSPYDATAGYDPYPSSSTPYGGYGSDSPYGDADEPPPQSLDDGLR